MNPATLEDGSVLVMGLIMTFVSEFFEIRLIVAGRIRKGPAPLNLEIPEYDFAGDDTLIVG